MKPVIEINNIYKKYVFGLRRQNFSLQENIIELIKSPLKILRSEKEINGLKKDEFWALKDISFKVMPGEVVGIIGKNGAGKSTLLKILSKITPPTRGEIILRGKVASLLEVGTGFHPELTGRENIFLNGAILGMKRAEIKKKFKQIIEFAEIPDFLDTPVKRYSSGMYMRLAFAVAAHLEPDILLVDEVLAVGDVQFQKKCLNKMNDISSEEGRTVIFISHNILALSSICKRAIYLKDGKTRFDGNVSSAIEKYLGVEDGIALRTFINKNKEVSILKIEIKNDKGKANTVFKLKENILININYYVAKKIESIQVVLHIWTVGGIHILSTADIDNKDKMWEKRETGNYEAKILIPGNILAPGGYRIIVACGIPDKLLIDEEIGPSFEINATGSYATRWSSARKDVAIALPLNWETRKI